MNAIHSWSGSVSLGSVVFSRGFCGCIGAAAMKTKKASGFPEGCRWNEVGATNTCPLF